MTEILPITAIGIILSFFSHVKSEYDIEKDRYIKKDSIVWTILTFCFVIFIGLRFRMNDTETYIDMYEQLDKSVPLFEGIDWNLGKNPGFWIVNRILIKLGFSSQSFILFYTVIIVGLYQWFIRKYTDNLCVSVVLFLFTGCYSFCGSAIKQCVAVVLCLVAIDFCIKKKWVLFFLFVFIASTFHPYALLYLVVPFLVFRPWGWQTYVLLIVFGIVGIALQSLVGSIVNITTMIGEEFTESSFTNEGVNPLRVVVSSIPLLVSFVVQSA